MNELTPRPAPHHATFGQQDRTWLDSYSANRYGLLIASAIALVVFSGSALIIPFVLLSTLVSYISLVIGQTLIERLSNITHSQYYINTLNWTTWVVLFVVMEVTGVVGTLTGDSATLVDQWVVTLGLPFYILSMAAANSDVLLTKRNRPEFGLYLLYVVYFPKFLSGPIERPALMDNLEKFRFRVDWIKINEGGQWILLGLFYKLLVGRYLSKFYFPDISDDLPTLVLGIIAFELRVYFDLCGYSLIAYGTSLIIGIRLTLNFNHPFFAGNIRDFWRSWHISLGRWFNEYVYEPIRRHTTHPLILLLVPAVVFLCSAAWHGITINFFMWGSFHALAFIIYTKLLRRRAWPKSIGLFSFFSALVLGRLLFMDADFTRLINKLALLVDEESWISLLVNPAKALSLVDGLTSFNSLLITLSLVSFAFWTESKNVKLGLPPYTLFFGWRLYFLASGLVLLGYSGSEGMIYARQ